MSAEEALAALGLRPGAGWSAVEAAYVRLSAKLSVPGPDGPARVRLSQVEEAFRTLRVKLPRAGSPDLIGGSGRRPRWQRADSLAVALLVLGLAAWGSSRFAPVSPPVVQASLSLAQPARLARFSAEVRLTAPFYALLPNGARQESTALFPWTWNGRSGQDPIMVLPGRFHHAALDPATGTLYLADFAGVYRRDPGSRALIPLRLPGRLAAQERLGGLAFDSRRERLVVAAVGRAGEGAPPGAEGAPPGAESGALFAYRPADGVWRELASLDGAQLAGLAYNAARDSFFGVAGGALHIYSPEGDLRGAVRIDLPKGWPESPVAVQVGAHGSRLALRAWEPGNWGAHNPNDPSWALLDLATGKVSDWY